MLAKKPAAEKAINIAGSETSHYIMLIDSRPSLAPQLSAIIDDPSVTIVSTTHWDRALELAIAGRIDLMICDLDLPDQGAEKLFLKVKTDHSQLLSALIFSRNTFSCPDTDFLSPAETRDLLEKPYKNDQAQNLLLRRMTRIQKR